MKRHFTGNSVSGDHSESSSSEDEQEEAPAVKRQSVRDRDSTIDGVHEGPVVRKETSTATTTKVSNAAQGEGDEQDEGDHDGGASDSDSNSDESDSDSDDSTDEEQSLLKPIFLSKKQRQQSKTVLSVSSNTQLSKERALRAIEVQRQQETDHVKELALETENCGGLDDTDGLDPERERAEWELRQLQREKRDREKEEKEMEELEELEIRRLRTEEEREDEAKELAEQMKQVQGEGEFNEKKGRTGAFFREEGILKRTMEGEVEKYDKSLLPQRYTTRK